MLADEHFLLFQQLGLVDFLAEVEEEVDAVGEGFIIAKGAHVLLAAVEEVDHPIVDVGRWNCVVDEGVDGLEVIALVDDAKMLGAIGRVTSRSASRSKFSLWDKQS